MNIGDMDLNQILMYKAKLGYNSASKMIIIAYARGNYDFFFNRGSLKASNAGSGNAYLMSFETEGILFMQLNSQYSLTGNNSFMARDDFQQIKLQEQSFFSVKATYNMRIMGMNQYHDFTVFTEKLNIDWLNQYFNIFLSNIDSYMIETAKNGVPDGLKNQTTPVAPSQTMAERPQVQQPSMNPGPRIQSQPRMQQSLQSQPVSSNINVAAKFCSNCGNRMSVEDEFCQKCGAKYIDIVRN